jgi:hypothetical protein
MDHDDLTPEERAEIERVSATLADPAVWAEPTPELQERVVAAIAEAAGAGTAGASATRRRAWYAVGGLAAAILLVIGAGVGVQLNQDDPLQYAASLRGTDLAPDASGEVTLTKTTSGWKIELNATGLSRRADGEFYEAWMKDANGQLVPIGTFNEGRDVVLWAGVPPTAFPTLTVTHELADGNQASSGRVVLIGQAVKS